MFDLTRRHAIKLLGSAAALVTLPLQKALALTRLPLHEEAKRAAAGLTPSVLDRELDGVYAKIFARKKSTMHIERVAHVRYLGLGQLAGRDVRVADGHTFDNAWGQRWIYNFSPNEASFAFSVVEDDDPRAGIPNSDRPPSIMGLAHLRQGHQPVPWRRSDLRLALKTLVGQFRDLREQDAAAIFNKARTYDPSIGGDGVAMVSSHHPVEDGTWSNAFHGELTPSAVEAAMKQIRTEWVDDANLKLNSRGVLLVVPSALAEAASSIDFPHVVWDQLTDPTAWFMVTTNAQVGLPWFERHPLELDVWRDLISDVVLVKGYERRCFGCSDPRAVLGAFPRV